jgi:hypothetical protein
MDLSPEIGISSARTVFSEKSLITCSKSREGGVLVVDSCLQPGFTKRIRVHLHCILITADCWLSRTWKRHALAECTTPDDQNSSRPEDSIRVHAGQKILLANLQIQAKAANLEVRVLASGVPSNHARNRTRLMPVAMMRC